MRNPADSSTSTASAAAPAGGVSRRGFLGVAGGIAGAVLASTRPGTREAVANADEGSFAVFQHGVASGDPWARSVILWTRVTSHPGDVPGGERGVVTQVNWEVARDAAFQDVVARGTTHADPAHDMTVKVEAGGLNPHTWYYYRFHALGQTSPTGRTCTAPTGMVDNYRVALLSCANWESGYFAAYRDLANRGDIELALHVGDYIYEYETGGYVGPKGPIRVHHPTNELRTLADYRTRYGTYRTDPDLQAAHAACPWVVTWDDHEVADDAWSGGAELHDPATEGSYVDRRNQAMQAYLEWLPIRAHAFTEGGRIYRNLSFGELFEVNMLDLRSYRNEPAVKREADNPDRTIMGSEQFGWLLGQLRASTARWNLIGNSVMIASVLMPPLNPRFLPGLSELLGTAREGDPYTTDTWDGFTAERYRLLSTLKAEKIDNVVFATGDIHTSWAAEVPAIPSEYQPGSAAAVEFVCSSINSPNVDEMYNLPPNSRIPDVLEEGFKIMNPYFQYVDLVHHGYCVLDIRPDYIQCDWIYTQNIEVPNSPMWIAKSLRAYRGGILRPAPGPI